MATATQLVFVTGKGGVGKTTMAAALGLHAAGEGQRVLIVETAGDGSLAQLFGKQQLAPKPSRMRPQLDAVRVDARQLVEQYFSEMLRFRWLSDRLLSSSTFNALTAAAPGITEFLLLDRILGWVEPGVLRRKPYDLVIVDGPATGHALKLLRTPRNLATMVPGGPLGRTARRLLGLLGNRLQTQVVLVGLAEEMVIRETIETHTAIAGDLALRVARPVINRVLPHHFTAAQVALIEGGPAHPLLEAARFSAAVRREADRHVGTLRRALGVTPILVRQVFAERVGIDDLGPIGRSLSRVVLNGSTETA